MDEVSEQIKNAIDNGEQLDSAFMDMSHNKTIDVYKRRMRGVYEDMYNFGYI